jgi:phage tail sheath protein FI
VTIATNSNGELDYPLYYRFQKKLADWCQYTQTVMAILDLPPGLDADGGRNWRNASQIDTPFATAYYPHLLVLDPNAKQGARNRVLAVPPSGHVAGVWARTDSRRGVWKAPANESVLGAIGLATDVARSDQDLLNPIGVNCIRA